MIHTNYYQTTLKKGGVYAMTNENFRKIKDTAIIFLEAPDRKSVV